MTTYAHLMSTLRINTATPPTAAYVSIFPYKNPFGHNDSAKLYSLHNNHLNVFEDTVRYAYNGNDFFFRCKQVPFNTDPRDCFRLKRGFFSTQIRCTSHKSVLLNWPNR